VVILAGNFTLGKVLHLGRLELRPQGRQVFLDQCTPGHEIFFIFLEFLPDDDFASTENPC